MVAFVVVIFNIVVDAIFKFIAWFRRPKIHKFCFQCSPKSFNPMIVKASASSVHADLYAQSGYRIHPFPRCELGALVGVYYLRRSMLRDSLLQNVNHVVWIQRVAQPVSHYISAVLVNNGCKVHEPLGHPDVCDVNAPHLIAMCNLLMAAIATFALNSGENFLLILLCFMRVKLIN